MTVEINRRGVALGAVALTVAPAMRQTPVSPVERDLEDGDFLWPKSLGTMAVFAPGEPGYEDAVRANEAAEQALWEEQRAAFLAEASADDREAAGEVRGLSWNHFRSRYFRGGNLFQPLTVGHVAIVEKVAGRPAMVIEAVPSEVRRLSFTEWSGSHTRDLVYHGRLRGAAAEARAGISRAASAHVGRPYSFFRFDLEDDRGFYCSKLAWLAVRSATGVILDGNPFPRRTTWFSPKQMYYSNATIQHLNSLGRPNEYLPA